MNATHMEQSFGQRIKNNNIVQAWLVLTLALFFGASLAGIQLTLAPTIEANKINETRQKVPELVFGKAGALEILKQNQQLEITPQTMEIEKHGTKVFYSVFETRVAGKLAGWVVKTAGQGYADKIELLIGLDSAAETITGLFVLDQKETPGLGNKIVTEKWRNQFIAKKTGSPLTVTKEGAKAPNEIDGVTGATISSRAVSSIINTTMNDLKGMLAAKAR
ncbi:MAG: FMN-binding protein [Desulfobacteraceae bacterium 4572_123]|nr:MAG: FMN-binding protein [Desulfobacteraceae bacterium 4572_123]